MLGAVIHDAVAVAGDLDRDLIGYRGIRTIGALLNSKGAENSFYGVVLFESIVFKLVLKGVLA